MARISSSSTSSWTCSSAAAGAPAQELRRPAQAVAPQPQPSGLSMIVPGLEASRPGPKPRKPRSQPHRGLPSDWGSAWALFSALVVLSARVDEAEAAP